MIRHMYSPLHPDPRWWDCHSIKLVPAATILSSCASTYHHSRLTGTGYLQSLLFLPCFASLVASFHRSHVPQRMPTSSSSVSPLKLTLGCRKEQNMSPAHSQRKTWQELEKDFNDKSTELLKRQWDFKFTRKEYEEKVKEVNSIKRDMLNVLQWEYNARAIALKKYKPSSKAFKAEFDHISSIGRHINDIQGRGSKVEQARD
ncbi:hypothetical protein F5148DRAFT_1243751 [Russula earlei]|uniref:Uncharacterized protein n=1 Tax=Russula earlei TaxID=71964 RepID=A0ACC0TUY8_9AGAM|nr:hypothetical protein F5148DRAFT_1243751 [Russula earlei]